MYVIAHTMPTDSGEWRAHAPDLPACQAVAASRGGALAKLKLAIEGELAGVLGRGESLPLLTSRATLADGDQVFEIHINLDHIGALAEHQQGRWDPTGHREPPTD